MELMRNTPDKYYELAIVDPPYGDLCNIEGGRKFSTQYRKGEKWNNLPNEEYFKDLFRVSENQICWGANYYIQYLYPSKCWISWYKKNPAPGFSDSELAFTSFKTGAKTFEYQYFGNIEGHTSKKNKIHPTQKPVALYKWLLHNYAKQGDKILDTHLGSGSIAIACHEMGFNLDACEIDKDYYDAAYKRFKQHTAQATMFDYSQPVTAHESG